MKAHEGKYVLVIEGAIPVKDDGIYCKIGGRTALELANTVAAKAGAIIAIGSCASWGGIPSADPNPTGATGAPEVLKGKTVVTIPGCPANPYNLLGVVLQFATFGTLPALDEQGRPKFAYGRTIHEHCPRRAHFDAGRFVAGLRRRGAPRGVVPLQDGLQGAGDARELLRPALRRGHRRLADRARAPLLRLHGEVARLPGAAPLDGRHRAADPARHLPADRGGARGRSARSRRASPGPSSGRGLAAGFMASRKMGAEPPAPAARGPGEGGLTMAAVDRRTVLKGVAATGAVAAAGIALPAHGRVAKAAPPDAVGLLYDTTLCIGCKSCVVACREANDKKPDTRLSGGLWDMPSDLNGQTKNVIKLYKDPDSPERSLLQGPVHALRRPGLRRGLHARGAAEARARDRHLRLVLLLGLPLLPDGLPVRDPEVRVGEARPEDRQVRALQPPARRKGSSRAAPRSARATPSSTGSGRTSSPRRRGGSRSTRRSTRAQKRGDPPKVYGETEAGGTQCLYLSHVPFEKLGLPDLSAEPVPHVAQTVQHGIYQGFVAPVALYAVLGAVVFRNRKKQQESPPEGPQGGAGGAK